MLGKEAATLSYTERVGRDPLRWPCNVKGQWDWKILQMIR